MRGEVLHYDETQGFGFIAGADGNRYPFGRENLRRAVPIEKGMLVEFRESSGQARDIFSIREEAAISSVPAAARESTQFGRFASAETPAGTSLWSYFRHGFTGSYANFRDRARRKEYWGFALFAIISFVVLSVIGIAVDSVMGNMENDIGIPFVTILLLGLFALAIIIPSIAITVRRIHDIGLSGWFYLLILVPTIGSLILFVFTLIPSQKHGNKWGAVPEGIEIPPPFVPAIPETSQ
ncbi:MAG: DUF805 domain-containing protein [Pseudaminobacter sp.]|nr:DUF805 domain-containing protein [Pseudaminobacter sp.]